MSTEQKKEIVKIGISISPGVAICPAFVYRVLKYQDIKQDSQISDQEVTKQIKKLSFAISHAKATVNMQRNRMIGKTKKYHLGIFEFQTYLLEDSSFIEKIKTAISEQRMTAYQAVIEDPIPPGKVGLSSVEAPRGETHHFVITGEDSRPYRWKARAPTYQNLQSVPLMVLGETIADVPIALGSFDPCFSCTERLETVDVRTGEVKVYSKAELEEISRNKIIK